MKRAWVRARSMWRALWRPDRLDGAMHEEMRFHIDMEAERLVRERGLPVQEARRQAYVAFGGVEKYKEEGRAVRGLQWIDAVSLDTRLGVRMLLKYRGLTFVGGFAMAVAIALGVTSFEVLTEILEPGLPLDQGDRVVAVQYATTTPGEAERRVLHDFASWRDEITSVEHLAAFRTVQHSLVSGTTTQEPVKVAEITASGFTVAGTPPLAGRFLLPGDEAEGAPPVVVIGYQAWQSRFGGEPGIVGREILLSATPTTVVGIMPDGFRFPLDHQFWAPLRVNPSQYERLRGPDLFVFGRLAPGVTMKEAQAELTIAGQRAAAAHPETHGRLRLVVLPYTYEHLGITDPTRSWMLRLVQVLVGALSFVVAVNLAILVYARTVTRLGEIAVRTALGASRRRILMQLFIEALALSMVGVGAGLVLGHVALGRLQSLVPANGSLPVWIDLDLSAATVAYAIGLGVVAAAIMGVVPGLKATSGGVSANLHALDSRTGTRLGGVWTTLVVSQVAVAVAVLPMALYVSWQVVRMGVAGPGFAAEQFVIGIVALDGDPSKVEASRVGARQLELSGRLAAEPGVSAVTFSSGVPGFEPGRMLEFEHGAGVKFAGHRLGVNTLDVGVDLFDAYGADILAGRAFTAADLGAAHSVIVNRSFVEELLEPGTGLGIRFRYTAPTERRGAPPATTYQIVGIVRDFPSFPPSPASDGAQPTVYHAAAPGTVHPFVLSVGFKSSIPAGFIDRFRVVGAGVDPMMQLRRVAPLSDYFDALRSFWRHLAWGLTAVTMSVLLLSAAGIYAMMSFTVAQRTREIAIRTALGASTRQLLLNIFGRATRQLALGVLAGTLLAGVVFTNIGLTVGLHMMLVLTVAAIMMVIGLLAALGPARRGLRIQAAEALKTDA
jgi:predicted permease